MKPKCDQNVTLKIFQIHQFRTSRPESLLVLVAGKTDYCLIMLQQGMLKVLLRRLHQPKDKTDNAPTYLSLKFFPGDSPFEPLISSLSNQVHINLGAGESEVSSPRGFRLDDLQWHTVKLLR